MNEKMDGLFLSGLCYNVKLTSSINFLLNDKQTMHQNKGNRQ
jgi:hypothetical protein